MTVHSVPKTDWTRIGRVNPGYPAASAGMKEGDEVLTIDGIEVHDWDSLRAGIAAAAGRHPDTAFPLVIRRGGATITLNMQPRKEGGGFVIGISPGEKEVQPIPFGSAIVDAAQDVWLAAGDNAKLIGKLITRQVSTSALSGPIGIISVTATAAQQGVRALASMVWNLSVAVGFVNMLPIPGLDGGRFLFLLYELVAHKRMNQAAEGWIHAVGLLLLLLLIVFVSYGDIMHLVHRS
jgi:regulator of sigma E protease